VAGVNLSRLARSGFILILVAMLGLAFYAFLNRPTPITDEDIEATVDARRTQTAVAVTPDFEATIETRLETTPTPPPPGDPVNDAIGGVTGFVSGVWDFFGFFGLFSQVICCILLPGLVLLGILNDKPRPR
jgi:hypothetical protein